MRKKLLYLLIAVVFTSALVFAECPNCFNNQIPMAGHGPAPELHPMELHEIASPVDDHAHAIVPLQNGPPLAPYDRRQPQRRAVPREPERRHMR